MKGIVYELRCHITDEKYIGSTFTTLKVRYRRHKTDDSCVSRHIIKRGNHSIKMLEEVETDNRLELEKREQYWMDNIKCINVKCAFRSEEDKKRVKRKQFKEWASKNKEYLREKGKRRYWDNYEKNREGDKRRKNWRRSWKPDGRTGFFNSMLDISLSVFE